MAATDVALITQQRSVADIVFPSKVLTLMASARPPVWSRRLSADQHRRLSAQRQLAV